MINATADRFWSKVNKTNECWTWQAGKSHNGYGRFDVGGRRVMAHRWAYEAAHGSIPDGLQLDHLCRTRSCVRPDHLEAVTQRVNIMRGEAPTAINAQRTHCIHGHEFTPENTYRTPNGRRQCRVCIADRLARHEARGRSPQASKPVHLVA